RLAAPVRGVDPRRAQLHRLHRPERSPAHRARGAQVRPRGPDPEHRRSARRDRARERGPRPLARRPSPDPAPGQHHVRQPARRARRPERAGQDGAAGDAQPRSLPRRPAPRRRAGGARVPQPRRGDCPARPRERPHRLARRPARSGAGRGEREAARDRGDERLAADRRVRAPLQPRPRRLGDQVRRGGGDLRRRRPLPAGPAGRGQPLPLQQRHPRPRADPAERPVQRLSEPGHGAVPALPGGGDAADPRLQPVPGRREPARRVQPRPGAARLMRRLALIAVALAALGAAGAATASGGGGGDYRVRAIFDNGGFVVPGEDVRIAGAKVGSVSEVGVTLPGDWVNADHSSEPGKAFVVMTIDDPGFQSWREDASCLIRPQSLLGEKYIDCTPTQPRAPGTPPRPPLETIPSGQPGAGERFLPLQNNGKQVDLDLVQDIQRLPYAQRLTLILNDLGAGLAARGRDLNAVIRRADPALRYTDEVLAILARQNRQLAQLARDSATVLGPLARERRHVSGFIASAGATARATAERSADLESGIRKLPHFLAELRSTMNRLHGFAATAQPVVADLGAAAPSITRATK